MLLYLPCLVMADTVVVVNPENPILSLTREQVVDIYMGRRLYFPDGNAAQPIDHPSDSRLRADFYRKLVDRSIPQINAYWARLQFTGRATPPGVMDSAGSVLKTVRQKREAIAYLESSEVDGKVKIVYRLK